jgi:SAM-dependent methyltransferase
MSQVSLYEQIGVAMTCRSYEEYEKMFSLEDSLLKEGKILDLAAGASSFIAKANMKGYDAVAVDPLYILTLEEMKIHGQKEMKAATEKLAKNPHLFVWEDYKNLEHHDQIREKSFQLFLEQYRKDEKKKQYIPGSLPSLPFKDEAFSLVLCNHFLFLYQEQFDYQFHLEAIQEMIRVTKKGGTIRIYPLVGFKDEEYPYLDSLLETLNNGEVIAEKTKTEFRFLPSATHYLSISKL